VIRHVAIAGAPRALGGWKRPTAPSAHPTLAFDPSMTLPPASQISLIPVAQDQGQFGRCAGETEREVETGVALANGKGQVLYSANYPYFYARQLDGSPTDQDAGTTISSTFTVKAQRGNCYKATWDDDTSIYQQPSSAAEEEAAQHKGLLAFFLMNIQTIKASIAVGFPVAIGFDVPSQMMSEACAESGMVQFPTDPSGWDTNSDGSVSGHAVSIWGYDDSLVIAQTTGALYCLNHWSESWGLDGRFWLPYEFVTSEFAADAHTLRMEQV
jgi:hypothetical protein